MFACLKALISETIPTRSISIKSYNNRFFLDFWMVQTYIGNVTL